MQHARPRLRGDLTPYLSSVKLAGWIALVLPILGAGLAGLSLLVAAFDRVSRPPRTLDLDDEPSLPTQQRLNLAE